MSDLQVNKQKQRMDIDTLVSRERKAENFAETNRMVDANDVISVEQTKKDQDLVSDYLDGKYGEISTEERAKLENTMGRNMSHLLVNDQKSDGDSPEMFAVKSAIIDLEEMLSSEFKLDKTKSYEKNKKAFVKKFDDAIEACENYISQRRWRIWPTGRRRKSEVKARLKRLKKEKEEFIRGLFANHTYGEQYPLNTFKDALEVGKIQIDEINESLPAYREFSEEMMSYADEIYTTMSDEKEVPEDMRPNIVEKPKLSTKAKIGYNKVYSYNEYTPSFKDMERTNADYSAIHPDTKWIGNQAYAMEFASMDNLLKEYPDQYAANKELIDELVGIYYKDLFAAEACTFFNMTVGTVNNLSANDVTPVQGQLRIYRDYAMFKSQACDMHGTCMKEIIKGLLKGSDIHDAYFKALHNKPKLVQRIMDAKAGL